MYTVLGDSLRKVYDRATSSGTKNTYKSNWNQWIKFCLAFGHNPRCVDSELVLSFFAIWKYENTTNKANYISKCISGIISTYNRQSLYNHIDRRNWTTLQKIIYGISTFKGRESKEAYPIRDPILKRLINTFNTSYQGILKKTMLAFSKNFALRIGEYTSSNGIPNDRTLQWRDIKLSKDNNNIYFIELNLSKGFKTNRTHKTVRLTRKCLCYDKSPILCSAHWIITYKKLYKQRFNYGPNAYVFVNTDGTLVKASQFRESLTNALIKIGLNKPDTPRYTPHSLRHGELTDLFSQNVPEWLIKKQARHSRFSNNTFQYCHLQSKEEANMLSNYIRRPSFNNYLG